MNFSMLTLILQHNKHLLTHNECRAADFDFSITLAAKRLGKIAI